MNEFLNHFSFGYVFRSYSTASADLGHMMLLPRPPESWDHRHVLPHPASWASQWTKLSNIKLLFAWLSLVHLEPAGPVPSQSLAWHSGSREHISSYNLKIPKELVLISQSGYQVSFSSLRRCVSCSCCVWRRRERLPTASASPPSSAFSVCTVCTYPILIPSSLREELVCERWACPPPPRSSHLRSDSGSPTVSSSEQGKGIPCCLFGHQCNLFFIFPNYESGESSYGSHLTFDLNSPKYMSESYD